MLGDGLHSRAHLKVGTLCAAAMGMMRINWPASSGRLGPATRQAVELDDRVWVDRVIAHHIQLHPR